MTQMSADPLVSVIIPNYNYGNVLGLCLRAVLAQTYRPLEIILVDDCSTDDSVEVARSLGVRVIRTPANSGVCAARNTGAEHARGEVYFFVDSDVALDPDAVAKAVALLAADPKAGAVCGNYDTVPLVRGSLVKEYRNLFRHYWYSLNEGETRGLIVTAIIAIPARVWAEVGPWDTRLIHSEGTVVADRLARGYRVLLDSSVRGRHDDDATMAVALRKVFTRTYQHVPFFLSRRRAAGVIGSPESGASLAAVLTAAAVPVAPLTGTAWLAALPAGLLVSWLAVDRRMYSYVLRTRGAAFTVFYAGAHFLINLAIAAGAATGICHWLVSRSFRHLHEGRAT